jgi:SAM-dependent methyltransferase
MSWLMAAVYDRVMQGSEQSCLDRWRADLLRTVTGDVVEIGPGTGANLSHYPTTVSRLVLLEPDAAMRQRLRARCEGMRLNSVEIVPLPIEPLPDGLGSFDAVVATLVLCSVPDLAATLASVFGVLRPGGRLFFLEHVAATGHPRRLAWQRRLEPLWQRVAGNCHLTRQTEAAILGAGFVIERIERASIRKAPPFVRPSIRGIARKPAVPDHERRQAQETVPAHSANDVGRMP